MTLLLNNKDVEKVLTMSDCLDVLEESFRDFANDRAVNRPRSHSYIPLDKNTFYLFKSMDGGLPRYGVYALRISSDIIQETLVDGRRRRIKIPAAPGNKWLGLVLLFSIHTLELLAIIQDGYLQRMRVGATSGIAAKYLSRDNSSIAGLIGTGWQAGAQVMALKEVRKLEKIKVYSPNRDNRNKFAETWMKKTGVNIEPVDEPYEAVRDVDILVVATNSLEPVFKGEWLEPGMHVNSIQGRELDNTTLECSDFVVVRAREQPTHWIMGKEIPGEVSRQKQLTPELEKKLRELGEIVAGKVEGRADPEQITLFGGGGTGGSSGLGIQFTAVGYAVYKNAQKYGIGREIPGDWFLEDVHP